MKALSRSPCAFKHMLYVKPAGSRGSFGGQASGLFPVQKAYNSLGLSAARIEIYVVSVD